MESDKNDLMLRTVHESIHSLYQDIEKHRCVIASILERQSGEHGFGNHPVLCSRELRLKTAIRDAIEVLDESRKAFKSKRLEVLRRQLTQALIESE